VKYDIVKYVESKIGRLRRPISPKMAKTGLQQPTIRWDKNWVTTTNNPWGLLQFSFGEKDFSVFYFSTFCIFLSRTLFWNDPRTTQLRRGYTGRGWLRLSLSLTEGRRWDKRHRQRSTAGSLLCWLKYVIRTSMNTWIISSIITNRASDRYFEHSKWVS